jgi:hypothetical protein
MSVDDAGVGSSDVRGILVWDRGVDEQNRERRRRTEVNEV